MKTHLKNLINRLSAYNVKLDKTALLTDKKWALIDDNGNQQSYIFDRNGELVMSEKGTVKMGKWKFYPESQSLRIDRIDNQLLLNLQFFDKVIMILRYDGFNSDSFILLADQNQIPDLNIERYLLVRKNKELNIKSVILHNNNLLEIENGINSSNEKGLKVTINGLKPDDGGYCDQRKKNIFYVKDGEIKNKNYLIPYTCWCGKRILIDQKIKNDYFIGDNVFEEDLKPVLSCKLRLGSFKYIIVVNGKIKDTSAF